MRKSLYIISYFISVSYDKFRAMFSYLFQPFSIKRKVLLLFGILFSIAVTGLRADTFIGTLPTGLVELSDYKYLVYLYVPQNYKADRQYALVISLPGDGESPENHMKAWTDLAKRRSFLVLVPTPKPREEDVPFALDTWLIELKKDISNRYRVDPHKIYLVGNDATAHYTSYLGTQYPSEFSAVAAIGSSWAGPFEKLIRIQNRPVKQLPFYIVLGESDPVYFEKTEFWANHFTEKGYPIYLEKVTEKEALRSKELKQKVFKWLEENSQNWHKVIQSSQKRWNEKALSKIENFFKVDV